MLTPETIEVGKFYTNKKFPGTIYLGILFVPPRAVGTMEEPEIKTLVIVKTPNAGILNRTVYWTTPVRQTEIDYFWNNFQEYIHKG